jgi:hypothetical protein
VTGVSTQQQTQRPTAVPTQPQIPTPPAGEPVGLSSVTGAFRRPTFARPGPPLRVLGGVAAWAAAIGGLGLAVGVRGLVAILVGGLPGWYEPTLIVMGLLGIGLTAAAFLTVQQRPLPWLFLGAGTTVLLSSIITTALAVP